MSDRNDLTEQQRSAIRGALDNLIVTAQTVREMTDVSALDSQLRRRLEDRWQTLTSVLDDVLLPLNVLASQHSVVTREQIIAARQALDLAAQKANSAAVRVAASEQAITAAQAAHERERREFEAASKALDEARSAYYAKAGRA